MSLRSSTIPSIENVRALLEKDMQAVDLVIQEQLRSDVLLINQLGAYIVNSGGKRLRPMVVLLAAKACGYDGEKHHHAAAIIEFIHTATLLHDDVVDASELRRGKETANAIWGNEASVLVGDFLYSRSFQMMVDIGSMHVMSVMADTTNTIAQGEVMQLMNCNNPDTTEARYMEVIKCKTAKLFEAGALLGAVLARRPQHEELALRKYGMRLGLAFQLVDDMLDYSASSDFIGKNIGDDLAEGKPTLPLIHAMREGTPAQRQLIRDAIEQGGRDSLDEVIKAIESTGAIDYTARLAQKQVALSIEALEAVSDSIHKSALIGLSKFAIDRTY